MEGFKERPTSNIIKNYVRDFNNDPENYFVREDYLAALELTRKFKENDNNFQNITIKVNFINSAFKTAIRDTFGLAIFIYKNVKNIDHRLNIGDTRLINAIRYCYKTSTTKRGFRENYCFATKYCHCHYPNLFPIYDTNVASSLYQYNREYNFSKFSKNDLLDYDVLKKVIEDFKIKFKCEEIDNSMLDRFFWASSRNSKTS